MRTKRMLKKCSLVLVIILTLFPILSSCQNSNNKVNESTIIEENETESNDDEKTTEMTIDEEIPEQMSGDIFNNGAIGKQGGVSSANVLSSQVGIDILKAGGNAVDATVATAFAVGVVEPWLSGIGGCGMTTLFLKDTNEFVILDYMETVPMEVKPGWFTPIVDKDTAKNVAVPGQVHGLLTALEEYGTMSREEVMKPAIDLARNGFEMYDRLYESIVENFDSISQNPGSKIYLKDGLPIEIGETVVNTDLANTLESISKGGIEEFYTGETAKKIVDGLQSGGSLITMEDMSAYTSVEREPLRTTYHGLEIIVPPPPSHGGDWLIEMLNILENYDLKAMGLNSSEYLFTFNEANRLSLADSYAYIGDPAFYDLPMEEITSKEYAKERVKVMPTEKVWEDPPIGDLPVKKLEPTAPDSKSTTHIAVIDKDGNIVSSTNTVGIFWGSKTIVDGLGFYFNSHIENLEHDPAKSESSDFVMPGKRVRTTIAPTLILKDGEPIMSIGTPGGRAIPPAIAAVINNVFLFDMNIQEAINTPRALAIDRFSPKLSIEVPMFEKSVVDDLEAYGYIIDDLGEYSLTVGGVSAIYLDRENSIFYAGGDPRRGYKALAY